MLEVVIIAAIEYTEKCPHTADPYSIKYVEKANVENINCELIMHGTKRISSFGITYVKIKI